MESRYRDQETTPSNASNNAAIGTRQRRTVTSIIFGELLLLGVSLKSRPMTPRDHSTPWRHSTPAIARSRRNHSPLDGESPACVRRTDSQKWILRADPSNTVIARNDARFCCRGGSRTALARACPLSLSKARGQREWNRQPGGTSAMSGRSPVISSSPTPRSVLRFGSDLSNSTV